MADLTRRRCLQTLAAIVAGSSRILAVEPRVIPFGFSLYGMKTVKPAEAIKACAEIGYDGVELALLPGWSTEPKNLTAVDRRELRQLLQDSKQQLLGLMENLAEPADDAVHRANLDRLKAAAELGHALSPQKLPVIETIVGGKPDQWDKVKDRLAERLQGWAKVGADAKTVIAVKPHVSNALHMPEAAQWLIKQVNSPWLKLAYDFSHFTLRGLTLPQSFAAMQADTVFIHVKDAKGKPEKFEFLLPGDGGIDYQEYWKLVKASGYRGPIVVEVSGQISNRPGYDPLAAAKRCYTNLAPAFSSGS